MATPIDTNSSLINNYNVTPTSQLEKPQGEVALQKVSETTGSDFGVSDELQAYERVLTYSIEHASSAIALTKIAQDGIKQQKDLLEDIKQLVMQSSQEEFDDNNRSFLAGEIDKRLQEFDKIANATNYDGENLLTTQDDSSDDLSIVSEDKIIPLNKVDTLSISASLRAFLGDFINNSGSQDMMLNGLDQSMNKLAAFSTSFENVSNELETMVKNQLSDASKRVNADIDFGKEVSDFSKTSLLTQVGYLMQTQANAHTQRTIQILK